MTLRAFDLFSGGGGFRQGVEKAGIDITAHCEIDKWAEQFYTQAFNTEGELYYNDATKIDTGELPDFDILLAGFPCQAFSIAGKRQGFNDTRGTMFFEVARILRDKRPRYFILENVKGLLNHDGGKTFQTILKILSDIGIYSIEWAVLNSKHFGVPQNRERVFIVGYPREFGIGKIFPIEKTSNEVDSTVKLLGNVNPSGKEQNGDVFDTAGLCPTLTCNKGEGIKIGTLRTHKDSRGFREISDNTCPYIPARAREDGSGQPIIFQLARGNNKGGLKNDCPTITKNQWEYNNLLIDDYNGNICKDNIVPTVRETFRNSAPRNGCKLIQEGSIRRLTPLECFRLQGFSDEIFARGSKNISDAQLYKIAGNSVTVNVVYEITKKIIELEKEGTNESTNSL